MNGLDLLSANRNKFNKNSSALHPEDLEDIYFNILEDIRINFLQANSGNENFSLVLDKNDNSDINTAAIIFTNFIKMLNYFTFSYVNNTTNLKFHLLLKDYLEYYNSRSQELFENAIDQNSKFSNSLFLHNNIIPNLFSHWEPSTLKKYIDDLNDA